MLYFLVFVYPALLARPVVQVSSMTWEEPLRRPATVENSSGGYAAPAFSPLRDFGHGLGAKRLRISLLAGLRQNFIAELRGFAVAAGAGSTTVKSWLSHIPGVCLPRPDQNPRLPGPMCC